jgi:AraC-like DNA-binding protein
MNYIKESNLSWGNLIDCYWESHEVKKDETYVYPSLPEPYINIYFPIASEERASLKGISSEADFFEMKAKLFGVRLYLRGYYQLNLVDAAKVSNQLIHLNEIGNDAEFKLSNDISKAGEFEERVDLFKKYFTIKTERELSEKESNISDAFQFLVENYTDTSVITHYAEQSNYSPRTITRWFVTDIGIGPKKLVRIIRFHKALAGLHSNEESGFYLDYGYYDQSHFIKEFKEFTGLSPEKYLDMVSDLYNNG